ncbi:MAG TPA: hypothetical protein VMM55_10570 [Thermohalobaculum sp.]|nr:hypothetical protein [Thermohalobaculum sp.]
MRRLTLAAILVAATAFVTAESEAEPVRCAARERIVEQLEQRYGETQRAFGLANDHRLVEVFASERGSWTILLTGPRGRTCLMAAGRAFQAVEPLPQGDPA